MKRKILSVLLICGMLGTCMLPVSFAGTDNAADPDPAETAGAPAAIAAEEEEEIVISDEFVCSPETNDDLLWQYLDESLKDGESRQDADEASPDPQGSVRNMKQNLSSGSAKLFDALKKRIAEVANGNRTSTAFTLSFKNDLGLTASASGSTAANAAEAAYSKLQINPQTVIHALLADCPYDLYWYDKGVSLTYTYNYTYRQNRDGSYNVTMNEITFKFPVAYDYAGSASFTVDKSKMTAVQTALSTIRSIVAEYKGLSDVEKLRAYKNRICNLTAYNHEAAGNASTHYVNPWQLIWVFDNNPSTKVVCEGYAKAFQYLCDLSSFKGPVYCISVSGTLTTSDGSGPHMWNIIHMDDGLNYMVDVTNCDNEEIAPDDLLFMVKPVSGSVNDKYLFRGGVFEYIYRYDSSTRSVQRAEDLMLSRSHFKDVRENDYFLEPVLWAVANNITQGTFATTFSPSNPCTRDQAVTFLWRAAGSRKVRNVVNPFTDVYTSDYYYDAVLWALRYDVTNGLTKTEFGPKATCSRGQIVTFLWRAKGKPSSSKAISFRDVPKNAYYYPAVQWAVEKGITNGTTDETFSPDQVCTRGQIVTFLYRTLK